MSAGDCPTFRVEIRVKNNRIIRARERLGYKTQADAARARGVRQTDLCAFETFNRSPLGADGEWTELALKIADALYADPEDLWPKEALVARRMRATFDATFEQLRSLSGDQPERRMLEDVDAERAAKILADAQKCLTPREAMVLRGRFAEDKTLEEVGRALDLSEESVRGTQARALRKLRRNREVRKLGDQ